MVDAALLHSTITEYEALDEKRMETQEEQKQLLKKAEEGGLDAKIVKRLIRELRRDEKLMRAERETLDEYRAALLDFKGTPLGAYGAAKGSTEPTDGVSQLKRSRAADAADKEDQIEAEGQSTDAERNADDAEAAGAEIDRIKAEAEKAARNPRKVLREQREAERLKEHADRPEPMFNN